MPWFALSVVSLSMVGQECLGPQTVQGSGLRWISRSSAENKSLHFDPSVLNDKLSPSDP